jgi:hypothetical protein
MGQELWLGAKRLRQKSPSLGVPHNNLLSKGKHRSTA